MPLARTINTHLRINVVVGQSIRPVIGFQPATEVNVCFCDGILIVSFVHRSIMATIYPSLLYEFRQTFDPLQSFDEPIVELGSYIRS